MNNMKMLGVGIVVGIAVMMCIAAFGSIGVNAQPAIVNKPSARATSTEYQTALDTTVTGWSSSGNAQWVITTTGAYYGGSCAKSGVISHNQQSKLTVTVTGPGTLKFYWNVSSELNYDFLKFYIDGVEKARISGTTRVWEQKTYSITSGTHTLVWNYTKDGSVTKGSDCGWVDKVEYTGSGGGTTVSIGEAVDNTQLSWTTGGNANWFGQTSTYYNGGDAAQSGVISHNQVSYVQTSITGPGTLTFYWKVSSEANYDFLIFYIDGTEQVKISGEKGWEQKSFTIASGTHTVQWKYSKDGSVNSGSDCGWLDKVEFTSGGGGGGGTGTTRYAVIFGISDYKAISDLSYCDEDANSWYDYLTGKGYSSSNIILLGDKTSSYRKYDGVASETNIKNAINYFVSQADEDDILAIISSGHGDKSSSTSHFICAWDCGAGENGNDGYLYDTELANIVKNARCKVFIFVDNCRSGGIIPEISALSNANKIYMTTTCGPNGYGYDEPSYSHGAWTYWFLVSGLMNKGYTYMEDCFAYANGQYNPGGDDEPMQYDGDSSTKFTL
ncbi:MAG: hypothetical protein QXJ27_03750 [Thermoplasmata archaeon]